MANAGRKLNLQQARKLLHVPALEPVVQEAAEVAMLDRTDPFICPKCHASMMIVELFIGINYPRAPPERIINPVERMALKKMTV